MQTDQAVQGTQKPGLHVVQVNILGVLAIHDAIGHAYDILVRFGFHFEMCVLQPVFPAVQQGNPKSGCQDDQENPRVELCGNEEVHHKPGYLTQAVSSGQNQSFDADFISGIDGLLRHHHTGLPGGAFCLLIAPGDTARQEFVAHIQAEEKRNACEPVLAKGFSQI